MIGLDGCDLPEASGFRRIRDPYSPTEVYAIPAIKPDVAVIHVHEADVQGNARIFGSPGYDLAMVEAASTVILTAERIIPTEEFEKVPELTRVPFFIVTAVVHVPHGASPTGCYPDYDVDEPAVLEYQQRVQREANIEDYLQTVIP
jgi:glutaconate CoA-transferase subunit A